MLSADYFFFCFTHVLYTVWKPVCVVCWYAANTHQHIVAKDWMVWASGRGSQREGSGATCTVIEEQHFLSILSRLTRDVHFAINAQLFFKVNNCKSAHRSLSLVPVGTLRQEGGGQDDGGQSPRIKIFQFGPLPHYRCSGLKVS